MKSISGLVGYYATEDGKIFSDRTGNLVELHQFKHKGYFDVTVRIKTGRKSKRKLPVHQLVLRAFVGDKPFSNAETRHLNGNPEDNRPCNLCWGTRQENLQDSVRHGTSVWLRCGENNPTAKLKNSQVINIKQLIKQGLSNRQIADMTGVRRDSIYEIRLGKSWASIGV